MIILITKYNLISRWNQLLIFLVFYFFLSMFYNITSDLSFVECVTNSDNIKAEAKKAVERLSNKGVYDYLSDHCAEIKEMDRTLSFAKAGKWVIPIREEKARLSGVCLEQYLSETKDFFLSQDRCDIKPPRSFSNSGLSTVTQPGVTNELNTELNETSIIQTVPPVAELEDKATLDNYKTQTTINNYMCCDCKECQCACDKTSFKFSIPLPNCNIS